MWNKDEIQGKTDAAVGRAKQAIADLTDDEQLRDEGQADEAAGQVEETVGTGRRKIGEAVENIGKVIKK